MASTTTAASVSRSTPGAVVGIVHEPVGGDEQLGHGVLGGEAVLPVIDVLVVVGDVLRVEREVVVDLVEHGVDPLLVLLQDHQVVVLVEAERDAGLVERRAQRDALLVGPVLELEDDLLLVGIERRLVA